MQKQTQMLLYNHYKRAIIESRLRHKFYINLSNMPLCSQRGSCEKECYRSRIRFPFVEGTSEIQSSEYICGVEAHRYTTAHFHSTSGKQFPEGIFLSQHLQRKHNLRKEIYKFEIVPVFTVWGGYVAKFLNKNFSVQQEMREQ